MVRIRLARRGRKSRPFYHLVVADSRCSRDGKFIEKLGKYDPNLDPSYIDLNAERIQYWYGVGAQLTGQAKNLVTKAEISLERAATHSATSIASAS
ncbi:MAG: 30S ribosomal protein S16 [Proteobacteria bacterium]|nr:30S ribosomal protein S16 [Pseudomonadota bacterium]